MSPSMLGSQRQAFRESSSVLNSVPLPSKLPGTPLMPGNTWNSEAPKNGVITPRSRGRSAIYSMARTPYSRFRLMSTLKVCFVFFLDFMFPGYSNFCSHDCLVII